VPSALKLSQLPDSTAAVSVDVDCWMLGAFELSDPLQALSNNIPSTKEIWLRIVFPIEH
jgi:hypothetical protein